MVDWRTSMPSTLIVPSRRVILVESVHQSYLDQLEPAKGNRVSFPLKETCSKTASQFCCNGMKHCQIQQNLFQLVYDCLGMFD